MQLPALPGWDREDLRILASSSGLHADGWLETPSRLVIQLVGNEARADGLRLGLYLPAHGLLVEQPKVLIELGFAGETLSYELQPGLNAVVVPCSVPAAQFVVVLNLRSAPLMKPANARDQRSLTAVLADLERLCKGATLSADC
jgi:hypothetical protein